MRYSYDNCDNCNPYFGVDVVDSMALESPNLDNDIAHCNIEECKDTGSTWVALGDAADGTQKILEHSFVHILNHF